MSTVTLPSGSIHYDEAGPADGPVVVTVHGYMMGGSLWRPLAERLAARGIRTVMPTFPLGAHPEPMAPGTDLSMGGVAAIVAQTLEALELERVTLLGNDSGGAIAQLVAADHPDRLAALVLTNCDAFEHCPPTAFKPLATLARSPRAFKAALAPMRTAAARRSSLGYGMLTHGDVDDLARAWVQPVFADPRVREDARRFTISMAPQVTLGAAERLRAFARTVLLAWAPDDRLFPLADARRLAALLPDARLETIAASRAFSMIDQPDRLAELVAAHVGRATAAGAVA